MNISSTSSFAIQNKVFGSQGELIRWSQLKSCRSKSAVTRYLREMLLPLGQNANYRIAFSHESGDGGQSKEYISIEDWFESRQSLRPRLRRIDA